jgi:hypothetical protein
MKLWLISQDTNNDYDTYDSAIVAAHSEDEAKAIHPGGGPQRWNDNYPCWAKTPDEVKAEFIGIAHGTVEPGVVLASFNAG